MSFSVVIPSKSASNLVPCIRAIREAGETCRIIVVDDGLEWRSDFLKAEMGYGIIYVHGVKPFVFARNVNLGIKSAGTDDVILLNDDALLETSQGFSAMAEASRVWRDLGVIAAACDTVGNPNQFRKTTTLMRSEPRMVCFVCVFIPRSTIDKVGLLDERFVGYGLDDDDYCLRVRNAGLKIGIFDGCYVDHSSLKSSFRGEAGAGGDFTGNMKLFIEKWGTDNWGRDRAHSQFAHLFPNRCPGSFHAHRCVRQENHEGACDFYKGPVPEL
jgi:GT2 family glycosyltransferase